MKASEVLRKGLQKFNGGAGWVKGSYGFSCYSPEQGCALGALDSMRREIGPTQWIVSCRAYALFRQAIGSDTAVVEEWNDAPERTFADVEAAFQKAIALAEAEGN